MTSAGGTPHVNQLRQRYKDGGSFDEEDEEDDEEEYGPVGKQGGKAGSVFEARLERVRGFQKGMYVLIAFVLLMAAMSILRLLSIES